MRFRPRHRCAPIGFAVQLSRGLALVAWSMSTVASARAEGDEPVAVHETSARLSRADHRPHVGLAPKLGRELHWARLTLAEDLPFMADGQTLAPILPLSPGALDPHDLTASARPRALSSGVSAVGQLVTGLSLLEVWRNGRLRQRHYVRPYVGMTGARLVWRIDF